MLRLTGAPALQLTINPNTKLLHLINGLIGIFHINGIKVLPINFAPPLPGLFLGSQFLFIALLPIWIYEYFWWYDLFRKEITWRSFYLRFILSPLDCSLDFVSRVNYYYSLEGILGFYVWFGLILCEVWGWFGGVDWLGWDFIGFWLFIITIYYSAISFFNFII